MFQSPRSLLLALCIAMLAAGCSTTDSTTAPNASPTTLQADPPDTNAPAADTPDSSAPENVAASAWPSRELAPSGPVDFGAETDAEWFTTGPLDYPLEWLDDASYDAGWSMYVGVWPWQETHDPTFAGGLPGTWMSAQEGDHGFYSTIEGGAGIGAGNRFPGTGNKFTMGGVSADFTHWANGPGAGGGFEDEVHWEEWSWETPQGKYGVAQLSPHVLYPPDGLNLDPSSAGDLLGYGYHPLPIVDSRVTSGEFGDVLTGDQSWTLFMNTANFSGPIAFILPDFYSYPVVNNPEVAPFLDESPFLDTIGSEPNQPFAVELWEIAAEQSTDANGTPYVKMARTQFPANGGDEDSSIILHNISAFQREALWNATSTWFEGGEAPAGELDDAATFVKSFEKRDFVNEYFGWMIIPEGVDDGDPEHRIDWSSLVEVDLSDPHTFRQRWNLDLVERTDDYFVLPEYYRLDDDPTAEFGKIWTPILASELPPETGLGDHVFETVGAPQSNQDPFETPTDADSAWMSPGPASPYIDVELADGSIITYAWYRFVDQPAIVHHGFSEAERDAMQARVEMIHREWTTDRQYLAPPTVGELVSLDDGVLVTPPAGMEVGYVPIVTRQALAGE